MIVLNKSLAWPRRIRRIEHQEKLVEAMTENSLMHIMLMSGVNDAGGELAYVELGTIASIYWNASPYDTPQFDDHLMYWERSS